MQSVQGSEHSPAPLHCHAISRRTDEQAIGHSSGHCDPVSIVAHRQGRTNHWQSEHYIAATIYSDLP